MQLTEGILVKGCGVITPGTAPTGIRIDSRLEEKDNVTLFFPNIRANISLLS